MNIENIKNEMAKQIDLMGNYKFSISMVDKKTKKYSTTLKDENGETGKYTKEELLNKVDFLLNKNENFKKEIYIKMEEGDFYNLLIDDVTEETAKKLLAFSLPTFILQSSKDNFQFIYNVEKDRFSKDKADFIVSFLNEKYGDVKCNGAVRYFRLVGFRNKKAKNNNDLIRFVEFESKVENNDFFFQRVLNHFKEPEVAISTKKEKAIIEHIPLVKLSKEEGNRIKFLMDREIENCLEVFKNRVDYSIIDFRIVKILYKNGFSKGQIAEGFWLFNDFWQRHDNPDDYLNRTISNAIMELQK